MDCNTNLVRRNGVSSSVPSVFESLDRMFDNVFGTPLMSAATNTLPIDLTETESSLILRASVPGFSRDQVRIEVHEGVLTIAAERSENSEQRSDGERVLRRERRFGSLTRRIALPETINHDAITASLENGEITVTLPKQPRSQARQVQIN